VRDDVAGLIEFAQRLLAVLDQGRKTATYKYAVLLALIDLCGTTRDRRGLAPDSITTAELALRVVELYWPHVRLFHGDEGRILRQNQGGQAEIVSLIERFRARHAADATAPLARARHAAPAAFDRLLREVEWKLVEMPLPKLQRLLGADDGPFLYRIAWSDAVTRGQFNDQHRFDNRLLLLPGVGDRLAQLGGLLRPIIERRWAAMVARLNADLVADVELDEFLFGIDRAALDPVKKPLLALQDHRCFYCAQRVERAAQVDHFVPWSRHPTNALDNLVVSHADCNLAKSDHLATVRHVERWRSRRERDLEALVRIADDRRWDPPSDRTAGILRGIYLHLPDPAKLWVEHRTFETAPQEAILGSWPGGHRERANSTTAEQGQRSRPR